MAKKSTKSKGKTTKKTAPKKVAAKKTAPKKAAAKKAPAAKKLAAKKAPAPSATPADGLSHAIGVLAELKGHWPALDDLTRSALARLATDETRAALGGRTRAEGVLGDALRWAAQIDAELRSNPSAAAAYPPARFSWFLERSLALAHAIRADREKGTTRMAKRGESASARERALEARADLLRAMESYAGSRDEERNALDAALGRTTSDPELEESIGALVTLAASWLTRGEKDLEEAVLATLSGLVPSKLQAAKTACDDLLDAAKGAHLQGRASAVDSPIVNIREGDVLLEMKEAKKAFEHAKEKDPSVVVLAPGAATRHVIERHGNGAPEATSGAGPAAEAPPAQAASPAGASHGNPNEPSAS